MIVGCVPATFTCTGTKQWVGAGESWGYIAGTGGKCFNVPKSNDDCNFKRFLHDEKLPILFRCAEFDESKYTKAVGRKGAKRVFFTRLSDVFDISVKSACSQTDRKVKNSENKQTIFVWIFMPTTQEQVVPATWGNLFKHFAEWENIK